MATGQIAPTTNTPPRFTKTSPFCSKYKLFYQNAPILFLPKRHHCSSLLKAHNIILFNNFLIWWHQLWCLVTQDSSNKFIYFIYIYVYHNLTSGDNEIPVFVFKDKYTKLTYILDNISVLSCYDYLPPIINPMVS
jgi:hypothetical protein